MKALLISCLIAGAVSAQRVTLIKKVDDMTGHESYDPSRNLVITEGSDRATFFVFVDKKKKTIDGLACNMVGLGACHEDDELIIMLEDSTRARLESYAKYNCDGDAQFELKPALVEILKVKKIIKVRVTNGLTGQSLTAAIPARNKEYFIQLLDAIEKL